MTRKLLYAPILILSSLLWMKASFAQTIHTTNLTVVYSDNQEDSFFENVTQFAFSGDDLVISQNGNTTSINRSLIRKITLEDVATTSIETYDENAKIFIYPNPTSDKLNMSSETEQQVLVSIFSLNGQKLMQQRMSTSESIDVSSLSKGIYIIKINETSYKFSKL